MTDWPALIVDRTDNPTLLTLLKEFVGIPSEDTASDDALSRALNTAGPAVETYTDRALARRQVVEEFAHHFGTVLLHNYPASGPVSVTLNGEVQDGYSLWITSGAAHLSRTGWARDVPFDWRSFDQVEVSYTAGYDPLPIDLATAIVYTAAALWQSEGTGTAPSGGGDVSRMSIVDVGSISYDTGSGAGLASWGVIPSTAREMLASYRRWSV
ncbi:MAG: hypothetical protein ABJQ23_19975 [Shimia thalassica]|uniref:hypothetical protein n=1 Tax=Pseudomonadota TaxID=1224 RepID=UPI003298B583